VSYPNADPEQYPSQPGTTSGAAKRPPDRHVQAFSGGMLAGIGIAIGLALVMHVVQETSTIGYAVNLDSSVFGVLFLGLIIGGGLGLGFLAAVPDRTADSAAPGHATPADQPPAPSA
jgi:hypothetical protein